MHILLKRKRILSFGTVTSMGDRRPHPPQNILDGEIVKQSSRFQKSFLVGNEISESTLILVFLT